jgi:Asp-tRNA(Asn)/Glu-tRNA(Gln) amidotransferase C subunit
MSEAERLAMLALMTRIEAKVDSVLEQLDGLLTVCERLENVAGRAFADANAEGRTLH